MGPENGVTVAVERALGDSAEGLAIAGEEDERRRRVRGFGGGSNGLLTSLESPRVEGAPAAVKNDTRRPRRAARDFRLG